ncbi:MAG: hypothetical protein KY428_02785 [Bacteroidetes bacterium]|nr:hypothetical protein [Bacteroidota bacterium]
MRKLLILLCLFCSLTVLAQQPPASSSSPSSVKEGSGVSEDQSKSNTFPEGKQEITKQDYANKQIEMADSFRAEGKIYVVVAVITLLLAGLLLYTVSIDRKLSKLEHLAEEKEANKHLA